MGLKYESETKHVCAPRTVRLSVYVVCMSTWIRSVRFSRVDSGIFIQHVCFMCAVRSMNEHGA